jgi:transcriptional regulator with XRE-family HTH domain
MPARPTLDRERAKQLLAQGLTQKAVAIRLGVTPSVICRVAKEKAK